MEIGQNTNNTDTQLFEKGSGMRCFHFYIFWRKSGQTINFKFKSTFCFKCPFYSSDLHSGGLHEKPSVSLKTDSTHLTKQMMQMIIAHNNNVAHNHDSDNGLKMTELLCI